MDKMSCIWKIGDDKQAKAKKIINEKWNKTNRKKSNQIWHFDTCIIIYLSVLYINWQFILYTLFVKLFFRFDVIKHDIFVLIYLMPFSQIFKLFCGILCFSENWILAGKLWGEDLTNVIHINILFTFHLILQFLIRFGVSINKDFL